MEQQLEAAEAVWAALSPDGGDAYLDALDGCLQSLAKRSRQAIDLRYRENNSRAEMAVALKMSEDGVKTLLRRARAALRECIERKVSE
jgi:RNA polymerase sigma-70 factor (ECF subfamily)